MLNLSRPNIEKIRKTLLHQEKKVKQELKSLEKDDPVMDGGLPESIEPGSASWMADAHSKVIALKENLTGSLAKIQHSLKNLNKGTYGICESCGKPIEEARLLAYPSATLCIKDSKKIKK